MLFLVDAQLPVSLAEWFRSKGVEATHVAELGMRYASDWQIWRYAEQNAAKGCAIVTKDEDFVFLIDNTAIDRRVVWVRIGNCSNRDLLVAFESAWPALEAGLLDGTRIIEIWK